MMWTLWVVIATLMLDATTWALDEPRTIQQLRKYIESTRRLRGIFAAVENTNDNKVHLIHDERALQSTPGQISKLELILVNPGPTPDVKVKDLVNNDVVISASPPSLSINALTIGTIGSVQFRYNGAFVRNENAVPYALCSNVGQQFNKCTFLGYGTHTVTATTFSGANGSGTAGTPLTLTFTISAPSPPVAPPVKPPMPPPVPPPVTPPVPPPVKPPVPPPVPQPVPPPVTPPVPSPARPPTVLSPVNAPIVGPTTTGLMTMWTSSPDAIKASSCEFAQDVSTALGSSWLHPYVNTLQYCAVNSALHQNGLACGQCYQISYNGIGGTDPGRAGSSIIQVVDSGSDKEFDCFLDAFRAITGASTGVFPVQYAPVPCIKTGLTAVVLDGNNAWYVKVLFAGGPTGVRSAEMKIGLTTYILARVSGATWKASLNGLTNQAVSFSVTYADGTNGSVSGCFGGSWPVATSMQCS